MSLPPPKQPEQSTTHVKEDTSICSHLRHLTSQPNIETQGTSQSPIFDKAVEHRFAQIVRWGAQEEGVKRRKTAAAECHSCSAPLSRPFACLTCSFVGCTSLHASSSRSSSQCMAQHWAETDSKCAFAVDPSSGAIFCSQCDDLTYPDTFENLFRLTRIRVEEDNDKSREASLIGLGRERGPWVPWTALSSSSNRHKAPCRGLRPLLNLSQTCFLSAILQAFMHNPLLKAYFLSDKHNRHVCQNGSRGLAVGRPVVGEDGTVSPDREKGCMCCEMDRAFEEFHNHDKSPFGPITMLYSMWHASAELEGYGQQDAHSFFLAALDQIHAHAKGQLSSCNCIAHQTFSGALLSSVTCSGCGSTSTTTDPILDIQLDFPSNIAEGESLSLTSMLRRFCAEERVGGHGRGYECSSCGGTQGAVAMRKLSIKKLPPVLSFQLKRFAHNATSTKIETAVNFPSHLNMRPYVESKSDAVPDEATNGRRPIELPSSLYEYDLFAVVTHEGKLDNGHYWADVLSGDEWWHCDDDKITPTTLKHVRSQNAYMLFYVKRSLAYTPPQSRLLAASTNGQSGAGKYPGKT